MTNYFYLFIVVIDLQFYLKGNSNLDSYGGLAGQRLGLKSGERGER